MDEKLPVEPPPDYESATDNTNAPQSLSVRPRGPLPLALPALASLKGRRVILASASPRRKLILQQLGFSPPLEIIPSNTPEDLPKSLSPFEYVHQTAEAKAMAVYKQEIDSHKGEPALIVAADTIVVSNLGDILEKPRSEKHHLAMLHSLRNSGWHKVFTAVVCMAPREDAVAPGYSIESQVEETAVRFDPDLTDDLLLAYVKTREGADKAGGYGIQGMGSILVDRINGSFDNVVGLPLRVVLQLIEKVTRAPDDQDEEDS